MDANNIHNEICEICENLETIKLVDCQDKSQDKSQVVLKPFLKWVGGKTQIIDKIIDKFPKHIHNYYELFLGGGSVLLALLQNINNNKINVSGSINVYDVNETLINVYQNIKNNPVEVITEIKIIINEFNNINEIDKNPNDNKTTINRKPKNETESKSSRESYYYWIRIQFNKLIQTQKNTIKGTAYFIFLNKTCFRGVYRESKNGFNVPYGHYNNPEIINELHIMNISKLIQNVNFNCLSFEIAFKSIDESHDDDFIYLDPPYAPVNTTSFVKYNVKSFNLKDHELLFNLCKKYKFLMSNSDVELVKDNFKDKSYNIETIQCKRSINSKNPESKINELLIWSY
jgi:DNA adenine methylase